MYACYKHGVNTVVVHKKAKCLFCLVEDKLAKVIERPNQTECIFGFVAWLTTLDVDIKIGAKHDCSFIARLVTAYKKENNLADVTDSYPDNLLMPNESELI